MNGLNIKRIGIATILTVLLLSTYVIVQPALACPQSNPQDISVQQAKNIIKHSHNVLILDVRNESEYNLGHLNDAVLIPLHELESRINELSASQNDKVIVYCAAGSRSARACQILGEHEFTKVYNMLGGITAWMEADYPIDTSLHYVTVESLSHHGNKAVLDIEPWLLRLPEFQCASCSQNQSCSSSEPVNASMTVLEEDALHSITLLEYQINGSLVQVLTNTSTLWRSSGLVGDTNKTTTLSSIEAKSENVTSHLFRLAYDVQSTNFNMSVLTLLVPNDDGYYNNSVTAVAYVPAGDNSVRSFEFVNCNITTTLSQSYNVLSNVADQLSKEYRKSADDTLNPFANRYQTIANELRDLSDVVESELDQYNQDINSSAMIIEDASEVDCVSCLVYIAANFGFDLSCALCATCATAAAFVWPAVIVCIALCGSCILGFASTVISCCRCAEFLGWIDCPI